MAIACRIALAATLVVGLAAGCTSDGSASGGGPLTPPRATTPVVTPSPTASQFPPVTPALRVTPGEGPRGTVVTVTGPGCPSGQLYFHDSYNFTGPGRLNDTGLRIAPFTQQPQGRVLAHYTVRSDDSLGRGIFVLVCAGGSPSGYFTVLR